MDAGFAIGAGKPTVILLSNGEPELMYKMTPHICISMDEVIEVCRMLAAKMHRLKHRMTGVH